MNLAFDPATERLRYAARQSFLLRQAALRLDLAQGITFQPETAESVEDQVVETLWAEGKAPDTVGPDELTEVRAAFAVLAPCREPEGWSVAATLFLGFPDEVRARRLAALHRLPDQLRLELSDGSFATPVIDRGTANPQDRLPAVLALRYLIPDGCRPIALVSGHPEVSGRWPAPPGWDGWLS
jgi:hypothetical protein